MVERKSYAHEFKLSVTQWTFESSKNTSSASRKFNVDRKCIRELLKQEESIVNQKRGSRSNGTNCTSRFPLIEQAMYDCYEKAWVKVKQSNAGGLIMEQSSLLRKYIQIKI